MIEQDVGSGAIRSFQKYIHSVQERYTALAVTAEGVENAKIRLNNRKGQLERFMSYDEKTVAAMAEDDYWCKQDQWKDRQLRQREARARYLAMFETFKGWGVNSDMERTFKHYCVDYLRQAFRRECSPCDIFDAQPVRMKVSDYRDMQLDMSQSEVGYAERELARCIKVHQDNEEFWKLLHGLFNGPTPRSVPLTANEIEVLLRPDP